MPVCVCVCIQAARGEEEREGRVLRERRGARGHDAGGGVGRGVVGARAVSSPWETTGRAAEPLDGNRQRNGFPREKL